MIVISCLFYTPKNLAELIIQMIPMDNPLEIVDFCAGEGSLLIAAKKKWPFARIYAFDKGWNKEIPCDIKSINNLVAKNCDSLNIAEEDLSNKYCISLANPPFNAKEKLSTDIFFFKNMVPSNKTNILPEIAFTILNIESIKTQGYLAIILPASVISTQSGDWVRSYILKNISVENVIELPRHTFSGVDMISHVIMGRKKSNEYHFNNIVNLYTMNDNNIVNVGQVEQHDLLNRMDVYYLRNINIIKAFNDNQRLRYYLQRDAKRGYGIYGQKDEYASDDTGIYPYIHTTSIYANEIVFSKCKMISKANPLFKEGPLVRKGDILVGRVGKGCIGKSSLFWESRLQGIASDCLFIVRPQKKWLSVFIYAMLTTNFFIQYFKIMAKGTGSLSININDIHNLPVVGLNANSRALAKKISKLQKIDQKLINMLRAYIEEECIDIHVFNNTSQVVL